MSIVGDVFVVLTVAGILIYVIGLVGLAMAIRLRLINDITTAWYVVSLLPRTVVAGQGVKIWLTWPLPLAMILVLADISVVSLISSTTLALEILEDLVPSLGFLFLAVFLGRVLYEIAKTQRKNRDLIGHFVVATTVAAFGTLLMAKGPLLIVRGGKGFTLPVWDIHLTPVISGTALFIFGGFCVGLCTAATVDHPLPRVQVTGAGTAEEKELLTFLMEDLYLVTHTEGYWHFLHDESNELWTVPDRSVLAVRAGADTSGNESWQRKRCAD